MRSSIVSAGLLALTFLTSQAALARPIAFEGNTEVDLTLRNSDITTDGLEFEARSIDELFDQLEARNKRLAGSRPRGSPPTRQSSRNQNRNAGTKPRGGVQNRQRNQNRNSGQRKSSGVGKAVGRFLRSSTGQNVATTLASGIAQRIANGRGGGGAVAQPGYERREVEEFLEARARGVKNRGGKSSGAGTALRAVRRFLNSNTGQTVAATLASGVAQRIANGGAGAVPQPGYVRRELEERSETH